MPAKRHRSPEAVIAALGVEEAVRPAERRGYMGFAAGLLLAQLGLFAAVLLLGWGLAASLAGHAILSLASFAWAVKPGRRDRRPHLTVAVAATLLYAFGTAGALLGFVVYLRLIRERMDSESWYEVIFPPVEYTERERILYQAQRSLQLEVNPAEVDVPAFTDVFQRGDVDDRVQVVAYLARHFKPNYAEALKMALRDPNAAIRTQAAAIAARLDDSYTQELRARYAAWRAAPEAPTRMAELADGYDSYAHAGLLSASVAEDYRERALELYRQVLARDPGSRKIRLRAVRLLLRTNRVAEANRVLDEAPGLAEELQTWLPWLCEALYRAGRYDRLRSYCRRARVELSLAEVPVHVKQAIELWGGRYDAPAA